MSSFTRVVNSINLKKLKKPLNDNNTQNDFKNITYRPFMISYSINLTIEGILSIKVIPLLIDSFSLAWALELFHNDKNWSGCLGYFWKSIKENIINSINVQMIDSDKCHMLTSIIDYTGFSDGSCVPYNSPTRKFSGSRSWELMSKDNHLIIITITFSVNLRTFTHDKRNNLRNYGFQKLNILLETERDLLNYMIPKQIKPQYTHEKNFEKLIQKYKGPKNTRVRAINHSFEETESLASAPPPYISESSSEEWEE